MANKDVNYTGRIGESVVKSTTKKTTKKITKESKE